MIFLSKYKETINIHQDHVNFDDCEESLMAKGSDSIGKLDQ